MYYCAVVKRILKVHIINLASTHAGCWCWSFFSFSFLFFSDVISQENVHVEDEVVTLGDVTKELNAEGGSDMLQEGMKEFDKMPYAQQQFFADNYRAMADSFK